MNHHKQTKILGAAACCGMTASDMPLFKDHVWTEFFSKIERHFAFLHNSSYKATSRKVCLAPAKLFCLKIGPPGTHMCRLNERHAAACRSTRIFSKGLHMLAHSPVSLFKSHPSPYVPP